jgi:hypothetical protein
MEASEWVREIEVEGRTYRAIFIKRPFREGIEVHVEGPDGLLRIAEMGLGEKALLEKVRSLLVDRLSFGEKNCPVKTDSNSEV